AGVLGLAGNGVGVYGMSGASYAGVLGRNKSSGPAVQGQAVNGVGGHFASDNFTGAYGLTSKVDETTAGVHAENVSPIGTALRVRGRARFTTVKEYTNVGGGVNDIVIGDTSVTVNSHIGLTIASNPGSRSLGWVERTPGIGYTLHMTPAAPPART